MIIAARFEPPKVISGSEAPARTTSRRGLSFGWWFPAACAVRGVATGADMRGTKLLPNLHPGEILMEEVLKPMNLSQTALVRAIDVPPRRINEIVLASGPSLPTPTCGLHAISNVRWLLPRPADGLRTDAAPP
jgi:hypothetical protein